LLFKPFQSPTDSNTRVFRSTYLIFSPHVKLNVGYIGICLGVPLTAYLSSLDGHTISG
jgi:hypothetical protein